MPGNNPYLTEVDMFAEYPNKYKISKLDFKIIVRTFFYTLLKTMVLEGRVFYLPSFLGTLSVRKCKSKNFMIDYQYYKTTGEKIYRKNNHTDGYMTKFFWDKSYTRFKLDDVYKSPVCEFKVARDMSRFLASELKNNHSIHKYYDH